MAKVLYGNGASAISGTSGGTTWSKNGQMRSKSNPTNKQSQAQLNQRGSMTRTSQEFRLLSVADRKAWNSAKGNFKVTDVFGRAMELSGNALYNKLNQNLAQIGLPSIDVPPNPSGGGDAPTISGLAASASGATLGITFAPTPVPAGFSVLVWATVGKSAGVNQVGSTYKLISYMPSATASPYAAGADYVAAFGSMIEGSTIFIKLQSVSESTGETGSVQTSSVVVAA